MQTAQSLKRLAEGKSLGGRPSTYSSEVLRKSQEYLDTYQDEGDVIPSIAGLAVYLNTSRERLHTWGNDKNKKEFRDMLNYLSCAQESALLNGGLSSKYNSAITKLVLSKHGYTDNPQANQGASGITVNVNRGGVTVQAGGQSVTVQADQDSPGVTLEHDSGTVEHG